MNRVSLLFYCSLLASVCFYRWESVLLGVDVVIFTVQKEKEVCCGASYRVGSGGKGECEFVLRWEVM